MAGSAVSQTSNRRRRLHWALLGQLDELLEAPLLILGFIWLVLLIVELVWTLPAPLQFAAVAIWVLFVFDFLVRFSLAPEKLVFLRSSWLEVLSLIVPALRIFRFLRALRLLRSARLLRVTRLVRVVGTANRAKSSLRSTLTRRGLEYVTALTVIIWLVGAAAILSFEREVAAPAAPKDYAGALWWTAMILTTMGSEYWPQTMAGRFVCFLLALYAFGVFGYITALLASLFLGKDLASRMGGGAGRGQR